MAETVSSDLDIGSSASSSFANNADSVSSSSPESSLTDALSFVGQSLAEVGHSVIDTLSSSIDVASSCASHDALPGPSTPHDDSFAGSSWGRGNGILMTGAIAMGLPASILEGTRGGFSRFCDCERTLRYGLTLTCVGWGISSRPSFVGGFRASMIILAIHPTSNTPKPTAIIRWNRGFAGIPSAVFF